jgi:hypothetical protein
MTISSDAYIYGPEKADVIGSGRVLYLIFALLAAAMLVYQLTMLRRLKLFASHFCLPILSFCMVYKNTLLYLSCMMPSDGITDGSVGVGYVLGAAITPLMMLIIHETTYRLHEFRNVHFLWFDLEVNGENDGAEAVLWVNRLISFGFFLIGLSLSFNWGGLDNSSPAYVGSGGYMYLKGNTNSTAMWLDLLPNLFLCVMTLGVGSFLYKYGVYVALGNNMQWRAVYFMSVLLILSHTFSYDVYPITSTAGEVAMLLSLTSLTYLVQEELVIAASYADFLHRSNDAFDEWASKKQHLADINKAAAEGANVPRPPMRRTSAYVARRILRSGSVDGSDGGIDLEAPTGSAISLDARLELEMVLPQASPKADGTVDLSSF